MIKKAYSSTGRACRVTFMIPAETSTRKASVCGEFNDWNPRSHPMKRRKDGGLSLTVSLSSGRNYRFRYLVDGGRWENDHSADGFVPNPYGTQDSLVQI